MHQEGNTMDNLDQTQEKRYVDQTNAPETNPVQEVRIQRPAAIIKYPPTPPMIKESDMSSRTMFRQTSLEEALEDHSDGNGLDDSIMVGTIMVGRLDQEQRNTPAAKLSTEPKAQPKNLDRELKNLKSINPPGSAEVVQGTSGTRIRIPTLPSAKTQYSQIRDALQDELEEFFDQQYEDLSPEQQLGTDMNDRFRSIRRRKAALVMSADDLSKVLRLKGYSQEIKEVKNEVQGLLAKVTNIRLSYPDAFSITSSTFYAPSKIYTQENRGNDTRSIVTPTTSTPTVLNRSLAAVSIDLERQERLDQIAIQKTVLQATENKINYEADLAIRHIAVTENINDGLAQPLHPSSPDTHFPTSSSPFDDPAPERLPPIYHPVVAQPGSQMISSELPALIPSHSVTNEILHPPMTASPMAWDSRTRNVTMGNEEGLITQTTTTTHGCIQSTGPPTSSHTHVIVCNSEACTNQVATDTRRRLLHAPVAIHTDSSLAQNLPQINTSTAQREVQQPSMRLRIQRDLKIGDCCYAKYFEDGLFYSAKIIDIHHSGETAVVKFDEYDVPEEVTTDDILPESPVTRREKPRPQSVQIEKEVTPHASKSPTREHFENRTLSGGPPVVPLSHQYPTQNNRSYMPVLPPPPILQPGRNIITDLPMKSHRRHSHCLHTPRKIHGLTP